MDIGFPPNLTLYKFFTDWGSLVAGVIAFIAALVAYRAGVHQANATREAAWLQITAIDRQRNDEITNVRDAVRVEITAFVKYVMGAIDLCAQISKGAVKIPRQDARYIAKNFWGDPVIYPAVADRVGLLPNAHAITQFYMRISEVKGMLEALRTKTNAPSITHNTALENVTPEFAASIAESLVTALQLARPIVANEDGASSKSKLGDFVQVEMVRQIDASLESAKAAFPNAESFKERHDS
ncbi:MAG: hypothetical protein WC689_01005 [Methylocystis sp.]|jgi:hypothetical protein